MPLSQTGTENAESLGSPGAASHFETYRRELRLHCYRMIGSLEDADDLVQETYLRAWKRLAEFRGESSIRTWLYKIATNACIDWIRKRRRRALPEQASDPWDPDEPVLADRDEDLWLEPFPIEPPASRSDTPERWYLRREAVSFAFLTMMQVLPPRQRAVLILRDVLGWSAEDVAELIETSVPAVKSALHRARVVMARQGRPGEQRLSPTELSTQEATHILLHRCVQAWENGDVVGLTALLMDDAILTMPPYPSWYRGRDAVQALLLRHPFGARRRGGWRLVPTFANCEPAFGLYRAEVPGGRYQAFGLLVLTVDGTSREVRISKMTVFRSPRLLERFGLSPEVR